MGNFSRDPDTRAADAAVKQYVAVRLQQGVPILDADWNLLDDLRRRDSETLGGRFIGDGVPTGSDGFRIFAEGAPDPSLGKQDFGIRQGLIIVNGKLLQIDRDFRYTDQPNFNKPAVDPPVPPLELKEKGEYIIFLDTWEREVDSQGEETLVDPHIGVETVVLLKREWAVRVTDIVAVRVTDIVAVPPTGHFFYALAKLTWPGSEDGSGDIKDDMLVERRDTDASPRREIAYRKGVSENPLVDTKMFLETLVAVRDSVSNFLEVLTSKFVNPAVPYSAAEVMGFESLRAIASLTDHGIALVNARALDARGALLFFAQLFGAEKRFLNVWKNVLFRLITTNGQIYRGAFKTMIEIIETDLGRASAALERTNLEEAKRSQDKINEQFADQTTKPVGFLLLTYLGPRNIPIIQPGVPLDLRYRVSGAVTPEGTLQVERFIDPKWKTELRNSDGTPFNLKLGPGAFKQEFVVTVTPSNNRQHDTLLSLMASATHNPDGLNHTSGQIALSFGRTPFLADGFAFTIVNNNMDQIGGVFQIMTDPLVDRRLGDMTFRLHNISQQGLGVLVKGSTTPAGWTVTPAEGVVLGGATIPPGTHKDYAFRFQGPDTVGQSLVFMLNVEDEGGDVTAIQVTLETA